MDWPVSIVVITSVCFACLIMELSCHFGNSNCDSPEDMEAFSQPRGDGRDISIWRSISL